MHRSFLGLHALGRVPLARRNLFQDRRRAMLSVSGVAAALLLVLVLNGVFAGAMQEVTAFIDHSSADVFISQSGVRTMHMSASALPDDTVERVRAVDGVAWAEPLRFTTSVVGKGDKTQITYVFGYDPATGLAGPRTIAVGEPPRTGQALVDRAAADEMGIQVGDTVTVLGVPLQVSGLSTNGTNIVNTSVFINLDEFLKLRGPGVNYVLVGAEPGVSSHLLADRVGTVVPEATVQTRAEFSSQEAGIVRDMATDVMSIITVIGFLIALAVVGLTLFTATLSKLRDYGVVKALGAGGGRLALDVAAQAAWTVALATAIAAITALVIGTVIGATSANVRIVIEPAVVVRTGVGALVVGALASLVPLRRVLTLDPASAFRRAS